MTENSAGLFHDSFDALFDSKDLPIGFNVFDFQGKFTKEHYKLLVDLLPHKCILVYENKKDFDTY